MVPSDSDDEMDPPDGPGASHIPPTIYVIRFHPNTRREAVEWLIEKIEAKQKYGGAELLVRCEPQREEQGVVVHVTATKIKLLEVAEAAELRKKTTTGLVQEFSVRDLDLFLQGGHTSLDTLLSPAEREFCVRYELENIKAKQEEGHVPGYDAITLYPGQSLVEVYTSEELITDIFPLHDRAALDALASKWYKGVLQAAPFEELRLYFGEAIAMYFSFLGYYTMGLALPALIGLAHFLFNVDTVSEYAFVAAFNLIWVTIFLELWKRRSAELAYSWGTYDRSAPVKSRPNYRGEMTQSPVTGHFEPYYPLWKTRCKVYIGSLLVVGVCIFVALYTMVVAFWAEEQLIDWKKRYGNIAGIFVHVPSAFYAALVWIMNYYYKQLATVLTEWENHRTQSDFDWHRIAKLVVFEFVNNFSSLFYIAFYIQDMDMLCSQVATMLIVTQMINHFQEALIPYVVKSSFKKAALNMHSYLDTLQKQLLPKELQVHKDSAEDEPVPVLALDPKDPRVAQAGEEASLDPYTGVYDDYLEMFLQFGYVFLFSSVYPMAAFWAVLNNILELKTDAFKLCRVLQRPKVKQVNNIGAWQTAFEILGVVAVMTNTALLCLSPKVRSLYPMSSPVQWVLWFVLIEHIILVAKVSLMVLVPDQPQWVRDAIEKIAYQAKIALRGERGKKSRRHLSRRFRSVHGMPRSGSRSRGTTPVAQNGGVRNRTPVRDYQNYKDY
ncbi:anoctamin-10-like isoform X2 [Oratosquilla oratoria]|uniref:anoctamin-10-like isoform X2 n=1 Tax=Oratosquilla oratoria TaxID=337810 RepID=UPI003F75CF52